MATKFGYVKREATNQLDWGAIATQFTSILNEEGKYRAKKKAEIDAASREMAETLENAPSGEYRDGNIFTADYVSDAQQLLLTQDRLLKQGILKPRDYAVVRANLNSSNKSMFKLGQAYQDAYKEKMERMNSADPATRSQMLEVWQMEQAEGLYNIRNSKALINPTNGMVSIGLWKDGKMDTDPNSFQTVPQLMNNLRGKYDYFDVRKNVQQAVEDLGMVDDLALELAGYQGGLDQLVTTSSQGGKYSQDKEILKDYAEWLDYTSDGMMSNPFNVTSILTNENLRASNGEQYTFTKEADPKKRKANEIFLNTELDGGGVPEFTKDQEAAVKDAIKERLNDSVDKKIKASTSRVPFDNYSRAKGEEGKNNEMTFSMLGDMYYGDGNQVAASEQYFRDLLKVEDVQKIDNVIYITNNGVTKPVSMLDASGNLMDFDTFAQSAVGLTGISNIQDSVDLAGGRQSGIPKTITQVTNKDGVVTGLEVEFTNGRKEIRPEASFDALDKARKNNTAVPLGSATPSGRGAGTSAPEDSQSYGQRYIDNVITLENITQETNDGVTSNVTDDVYVETKLKPYIQGFGFKIKNPKSLLGTNYLEIFRPGLNDDKEEKPHYFYTDKGADGMKEQIKLLKDYLKTNLSDEFIDANESFISSQIGGKEGGKGKKKAY
jgi:hypothetical protein